MIIRIFIHHDAVTERTVTHNTKIIQLLWQQFMTVLRMDLKVLY